MTNASQTIKVRLSVLLLVVMCFFGSTEAQSSESCLTHPNVTHELTYLCGLTCDNWWYYKYKFTVTPGNKCLIDAKTFSSFMVINTCMEVQARYSSALYDSYRSCSYNATGVPMTLNQTMSNYGICDLFVEIEVPHTQSSPCVYIEV